MSFMERLASRKASLETVEEWEDFERDVDRFASRFVGARGKSPGTFANLVERRPRFQCPLLRMFHHDEIPQKKKGYTRFVAISDTHCMHETVRIPPGDVLLHCGDILFLDSLYRSETSATRLRAFDRWIGSLPHDRKIVIGGNHDACLEEMDSMSVRGLLKHCTYLENEHVTLAESGLRIFGSPASAPNEDRSINKAFQKCSAYPGGAHISKDSGACDVLLLHGPPSTIPWAHEYAKRGLPCVVIHGHVHEEYGVKMLGSSVVVNVSTMGSTYSPTNPPIVIDIPNNDAPCALAAL